MEARLPQRTRELVEYLAIPSEGGDATALRAAAHWTARRLRTAGAAARMMARFVDAFARLPLVPRVP